MKLLDLCIRNIEIQGFSIWFLARKFKYLNSKKKYLIYGDSNTAFVWQKKSTNTASVNYKTSVFSN